MFRGPPQNLLESMADLVRCLSCVRRSAADKFLQIGLQENFNHTSDAPPFNSRSDAVS